MTECEVFSLKKVKHYSTLFWTLIRYIKSKKEQVLSESEVPEIKNKIKNTRLEQSFATSRAHIKNVRDIIRVKGNNSTPGCPKCGGAMILREIKKGANAGKQFWGCSSFPKCRGVKSV